MKNKQTAVEWLMMQLPVFTRVDLYEKKLYEQAKAMEKDQMIKFADAYADHKYYGTKTAEEYYNETYGRYNNV